MLRLPREGRYWLLAVLVLFAAGYIKGVNLILLLANLMVAVLLLNWLLAFRQVRGIAARRQMPALIHAGQEAKWELIVSNARTSRVNGLNLTDIGPDHELHFFVSRLEPGTETKLLARTVFPRRGRYKGEAIKAECLYPFGLIGRSKLIGDGDEWTVLPRLGRLNGLRFRRWLSTAARGDGRVHRLARPSMTRQDDLHGLRPFRPSDSPRWIHWRTSARRNQKMVREFEEAAGQNLVIVVDPWTARPGPPGTDPELEDSISLAASICDEWCSQRQDQIYLVVAGQDPKVCSGYTCRSTLVQLLQMLACAEAQTATNAKTAMRALERRSIQDAPVLVIGSRKSSPLAAEIGAAWHRLVLALSPATAHDFYEAPGAPGSQPRAQTAAEFARS